MGKRGGQKRKPALDGTNLWRDPRTGVYVWRRKHKLTGKRFRRSTGTKNLRIALGQAQKFEEEYQREIVGLSNFADYRRPLVDFLEPFLAAISSISQNRRERLRAQLLRAFRLLGLDRLADLENFIQVERRLLRLEGTGSDRFRRKTLATAFQSPLKQFSTYLAGRREILADHLAAWPKLKIKTPPRRRRALTPEEFVRILAASDYLEKLNCYEHPMRPVWTTSTIAGCRGGVSNGSSSRRSRDRSSSASRWSRTP
jgi:integrase